jgi:hypothetical protein
MYNEPVSVSIGQAGKRITGKRWLPDLYHAYLAGSFSSMHSAVNHVFQNSGQQEDFQNVIM